MILFDGIYAPNIQAIIHRDGHELLSRYETDVVTQLGHDIPFQMCAVELLLVPKTQVTITISSHHSWVPAKCLIFAGEHSYSREHLISDRTTLIIDPPSLFGTPLTSLSNEFPKHVVRILLYGDQFEIHQVTGSYRAPYEYELPKQKMMIYGTSISQGIGATGVEQTYAWQLSRMLDALLYNYALSGKCFIERYVVDAIVQSEQFDIIIYECSVNMLGSGYSIETYEQRLQYLFEQTSIHQPQARVFVTSILPYFGDYGYVNESDCCVASANQYRQTAKRLSSVYPNITYMDPIHLLDENNLSVDLIHPSNFGMQQIARTIARYIKGAK